MPVPTDPESCIPKMKSEGKPQDQAVAICLNKQRTGQIIKPCIIQQTAKMITNARLLTAQIEFASIMKKKALTISPLKIAQIPEAFDIPADEKEQYHAYFLIRGNKVNENDWGVVGKTIPEYIQTFEGRPFLITADEFIENSPYRNKWMHPNIRHFQSFKPEMVAGLDPDNFDDAISFQETWKVGNIPRVLYDAEDDYWKCLVRPDPKFEFREFPPFCSCAIFQEDMGEPQERITKWKGLHMAGLKDQPAFGDESIYQGTCHDDLDSCTLQFATPKSLFETTMLTSQTKIASMLSTDNPQVNVVPVEGEKKKKKRKF